MKRITTILLTLIAIFSTQAQVVNVCGTDSVTLTVENYQNGLIEWQESIDTLNWVTIPEIAGKKYIFYPKQSKYYRAVVKTSTCSPLYSEITYVQLPPVSNAGSDRVVGGCKAILLGNKLANASGLWTILSGTGGVISNPSNPYSEFTGTFNQTYQLVWTVTNGCGQSSDTVNYVFQEMETSKNVIVVDNTDSLYSDSTEMASGLYRIKFSDLSINPKDSVLLIGMREDFRFFRKVLSFTYNDSIFNFITEQGKLDELFKKGNLSIGDALNQSILESNYSSSNSKVRKINVFPTRETLKHYSKNIDNNLLYSEITENSSLTLSQKKVKKSLEEDGYTLKLPMPLKPVIDMGDINGVKLKITVEGEFEFTPNFVIDISSEAPHDFEIGMKNAIFKYTGTTTTEIVGEKINKTEQVYPLIGYKIWALIGAVPIYTDLEIKIVNSIDLIASGSLNVTQKYNTIKPFDAMLVGNIYKNNIIYNPGKETTSNLQASSITGTVEGELKIGPKISLKVMDFIGPYFEIGVNTGFEYSGNTNLDWNSELKAGLYGNIGVEAGAFGYDIFDIKCELLGDLFTIKNTKPSELVLLSGNNQKGSNGVALSNPIVLQVLDNFGVFVSDVQVRFKIEEGNGTITNKILKSNDKGIVKQEWILGSSEINKITVYILDAKNNTIGSPIEITAYTTPDFSICENTDLNIYMSSTSTYKYPVVSGGTKPYKYSKDGFNFSADIPKFNLNESGAYQVYVKDFNGCLKKEYFDINIQAPQCKNSILTMDVSTMSNTITVKGKWGTSPYSYKIDNDIIFVSSASESKIYSNLTSGTHTVYVQDANGCVASTEVNISEQATPAIKAIYPLNSANYIPLSNINFSWNAGVYAINQMYDIYIKRGDEAFTLIANNLIVNNFTYTNILSGNTKYFWKVSVKDQNGIEKEIKIFTFTTVSGVVTAPTVPVLLLPTNGTTAGLTTSLKWTPQAGDFKYDVYLDTKDASTLIALNLITSEYAITNLEIGKTYYWKVKIKSTITGATATSTVWSFTAQKTDNTVTDIDGNVYHTVTIGNQTWMVENLKTTRYRNGEFIGTTTPATKDINSETTPRYQWAYNGDESYVAKYGRLYTWYAAIDSRNITPVGWHVATSEEWEILINYLSINGYSYNGSATSNGIAKALAATTDWNSSSSEGAVGNDLTKNNRTGFTALPGGFRTPSGYAQFGNIGMWWGSGLDYHIDKKESYLHADGYFYKYGLSVRCVSDYKLPSVTTKTTTNLTLTTATSGGLITNDGGEKIIKRGVCWNTTGNPTISDSKTIDGIGIGSFSSEMPELKPNTKYFVRAYATNFLGIAYGNEINLTTTSESQTIIDIDGNMYHTIRIGTQTWMVENLKTTRYRNGDEIGTTTSATKDIRGESTPKYQWAYKGIDKNVDKYGRLYTWYAVTDTRNIAPAGWHVATDAEWNNLQNYLIANSYNYDGTTFGNKIAKSLASTTDWNTSTYLGSIGNDLTTNNSSGFTALPSGSRRFDGTFEELGSTGTWWSSTDSFTAFSWMSKLEYGHYSLYQSSKNTECFSVRCVKDE